jgi:hypothetical protein
MTDDINHNVNMSKMFGHSSGCKCARVDDKLGTCITITKIVLLDDGLYGTCCFSEFVEYDKLPSNGHRRMSCRGYYQNSRGSWLRRHACPICFEMRADTVDACEPNKHSEDCRICLSCRSMIDKCPFCRAPIAPTAHGMLRVYEYRLYTTTPIVPTAI